jgi:hypothetical protein
MVSVASKLKQVPSRIAEDLLLVDISIEKQRLLGLYSCRFSQVLRSVVLD